VEPSTAAIASVFDLVADAADKGSRSAWHYGQHRREPVKSILNVPIPFLVPETNDVAAQNPEMIARLRSILEKQHTKSELFPLRALDN
jgi:hypothetical protein